MERLPTKLVNVRRNVMLQLAAEGWSAADIARIFRMHRATALRILKLDDLGEYGVCCECGTHEDVAADEAIYHHEPSEKYYCWTCLRNKHPEYADELLRKSLN